MAEFHLGSDPLTTTELVRLSSAPAATLQVSDEGRLQVRRFRQEVDKALRSGKTIYGINTGFGFLADVVIEPEKLPELQVNLIRSHACGVGRPLAPEVVRGILILRAHTLCLGHSGASEACLDQIMAFIEHDILPVIPCKGSVGASGDLAPLAHLAMGLMGEGQVDYGGHRMEAGRALQKAGLRPYHPGPKEGLSLINGTHMMSVLAAMAVEEAAIQMETADICGAMSLDAVRGSIRAFDERLHRVRPYPGQQASAALLRDLFSQPDPILESHRDCDKVQDPYSFRCMPQVHGASRDVLAWVRSRIDTELNSVTDNPLCFDGGEMISGGNFHGQPVAMAMDFLCMAVAELGSISERRIEKLTNPNMSGLPAFVTKDEGLNSGYMIPHVVAASLVSENKILCHPASVDSIPTSADKEDHVSMGPIAARKALEISENVFHILAIELLTACQGLEILKPLRPNPVLVEVFDAVRQMSGPVLRDRSLSGDVGVLTDWLRRGELLHVVRQAGVQVSSVPRGRNLQTGA